MNISLLDIDYSNTLQTYIVENKQSKYEKASIFSKITFSWTLPLIKVI